MIIVLIGYPGVGKLTIGRELAALIDGRMLDIAEAISAWSVDQA